MTLVVVDDEPGVADGLCELLREWGLSDTHAAASAEEAVDIINRLGRLDVLVTDVVMQGYDGITLRDTLLEHFASLRTVFMSAYDLRDHAARIGDTPLLPKPVDAEQLAAILWDTQNNECPSPGVALPPPVCGEPLAGGVVGDYEILEVLAENEDSGIYLAVQRSIGRQVRLSVLRPDRSSDPSTVQRFLAEASAKANVRHSRMLTVYEGGQSDGVVFYATEHLRCHSLRDLLESGATLNADSVLRILHDTADVMAYLDRRRIPRSRLTADAVLLDHRGEVRLANIASYQSTPRAPAIEEISEMGAVLTQLVEAPAHHPLASILSRMAGEAESLNTWSHVLRSAQTLTPALPPHYRLDRKQRAAIEGRKRELPRGWMLAIAGSLAVVALGAFGVAMWRLVGSTHGKDFSDMIEIPAGEFVYQDGEKVELPTFWIDKHEVTIKQYAEFLAWTTAHPAEAAKLAHPAMPLGKSFEPAGWKDEDRPTGVRLGYYFRASIYGKLLDGTPLDLDCPVFGVDWFDAYSYAKWKGHRLPSEQEWEKAARGAQGFLYPWGDQPDTRKANTGVDEKHPDARQLVDGYRKWAPVDAHMKDRSPYGVIGMGGNVSEWTSSFAPSPLFGGEKVPVIRGGNYATEDCKITRRVLALQPMQSRQGLGFRTVSDAPPTND